MADAPSSPPASAPGQPVAASTNAANAAKKTAKKPYLILFSSETSALENEVSKLILQGYRPHGSLQLQVERDELYFYQPMIHHSVLK